MAKEKVNLTPSSSTSVSFDKQLSAVEQAMLNRQDAEASVKKLRAEMIQVLDDYRINMRGVALTDTNLQEILERIIVNKKRPVLKEKEAKLVRSLSYRVKESLPVLAENKELVAYFGKAIAAKAKALNSLVQSQEGHIEEDEVATEKARGEFTAKFRLFQKAVDEYENQKTIIANAKEYVSFVKDVAEISAVQSGERRGKK